MIVFWIAVGVISAAVAGLILRRAARAAATPQGADSTLPLYRRQLAEIDELADRGLIAADERRSAHAEAARRLLSAAETTETGWVPGADRRRGLVLLAGLAPVAALALYLVVGSPGYGDRPQAQRLAQWRAMPPTQLDAPQMAAVLRAVTAERPGDPEPYRFLSIAEMASGDPAAAARALRQAIGLAPERADLWESLGEALMMEADGEVTQQAAAAFQRALEQDPQAHAARFHLARGQIEAGEVETGLARWRALLADLPADDPRRPVLQAAIADVAEGPRPKPAPQVGAPEIQAMVDGLAARLAAEPDDPEGWVRLVRSYAVLGDVASRDSALAVARARYANDAQILSQLAQAAATEPMR
ncbi:MAG: c-type cytochrome biogenesis protein CcmI [Phenylobacterium sp.]|uniref:c-type cytochrome biogenesis protein CcmI n=1 Tax=Phenylobacterium sp. TaxID=1871053 RepID=UPI0027267B85|nr:c-type cytochrome biogenesis protein CcmI [Phenylobacterium sp.]MDO8410803.1 c-type cytochrome biogenesis protein CcmI [Phenylobacterium sp.]